MKTNEEVKVTPREGVEVVEASLPRLVRLLINLNDNMQYNGKLCGKIGRKYLDLGKHSDDYDRLADR